MKLIKLAPDKYCIVQDDCQRIVELKSAEKKLFTIGTKEQISTSTWYGWEQLAPMIIENMLIAEVIRQVAKLKSIKRYCVLFPETDQT